MTDHMAGQRVNVADMEDKHWLAIAKAIMEAMGTETASTIEALVRSPYPPISGDEGRSGDKRVVSRRGPK